jgi:hypothetical protein
MVALGMGRLDAITIRSPLCNEVGKTQDLTVNWIDDKTGTTEFREENKGQSCPSLGNEAVSFIS